MPLEENLSSSKMFLMTKLELDGARTSELHELVEDEKIRFLFSEIVSFCIGGSEGGVPSSSSSCLQLNLRSIPHSLLTLSDAFLKSTSSRRGLSFILFLKTSMVTLFFSISLAISSFKATTSSSFQDKCRYLLF